MSLIYIEFISRRPGVALEAFHAVAGGGQDGWAGDYDSDVAVLNLVVKVLHGSPTSGAVAGWFVAMTGNYVLNRLWTFRARGLPIVSSYRGKRTWTLFSRPAKRG